MTSSVESASSQPSWLHEFVSKHWKLLLVSTVIGGAIGGGSYYAFAKRKRDKKQRKPSRPTSSTSEPVSPAQEEQEHVEKVAENESPDTSSAFVVATTQVNGDIKQEQESEDQETEAKDIDYTQLSEEERDKLAQAAKTRGNKYFSGQKYDKAISLYTKAIEISLNASDKKCAVFYSNRAACWYNIGEYDKVIEDATAALKIDPLYVKVMTRRGNAYEKKEMFAEALEDLTTACVLEEFKSSSSLSAADRALRGLVTRKAKEILSQTKRTELPSLAFVSAFLNSFRYDYKVPSAESDASGEVVGSGDDLYLKAADAFSKQDWELADKLVSQAVDASPQKYMAKALNLRGTFSFLKGSSELAKEDLEESIRLEPSVNAYIKMASLEMEMNVNASLEDALVWFEKAIALNPNDPDIYYHRGQIYFLVQQYGTANQNYEQSLQLDPDFVLAKVQKAICAYREGQIQEAGRIFESAQRQHSKNPDVFYYHGEILLDQQKIDEAMKLFDRAIEINPSLPLPYLNKGIVYFHMKGDFERAIEYTQKAIEVDPRCDLAFTHLAQMYMQQGKLEDALSTYKRAVELARTQIDIENAVMGLEAVKAQQKAMERISKHRK